MKDVQSSNLRQKIGNKNSSKFLQEHFYHLSPFIAILAMITSSCSVLVPEPAPTPTPVSTATTTPAPSMTSTIRNTTSPSITPTPTAQPTGTSMPQPTKTSTPQPKWVTDFAQPIFDVIALRTPNYQDDFDDKSGGWQTDRCGQRMKYVDSELVLTDCRAYRGNMNYADFVIELDARFLPDTNVRSTWQFLFRRYDTLYTHLAVAYDGSVFIVDLLGREHLEFSSVANPGLETNHLLVIAKGTKFAFYVNNKPFYYLDNPSAVRQGDILLGSDDGSGAVDLANPAIVAFDNFKIWNIKDITTR
jgi:hypothetical protein